MGTSKHSFTLLAALVIISICSRLLAERTASFSPALLSYRELVELYEDELPERGLQSKLTELLTTPFIGNGTANNSITPSTKVIRVALWNIERGVEFEAVKAAITNDQPFFRRAARQWKSFDSKRLNGVLSQSKLLQQADIIILNEVDWGLKRSGYRNVAKELAAATRMNYAYGVEFVEVDPLTLGFESLEGETAADRDLIVKNTAVDKSRTVALHGTAILSRFPLSNVRILRFQNQGHDWFVDEKKGRSKLEEGKQKAAGYVFSEKIAREVRRGSRMALIADIKDASLPEGMLTIVATHLENKTKAENRRKQLEEILAYIKDTPHPLILAGDMNTSGSDATPTSFEREVKKRLGSEKFWVTQGIKYATGWGLFYDLTLGLVKSQRMRSDPTVKSVRFVSENPEEKFFSTLKEFRFSDGGAFDFRGVKQFSAGGHSSTLSNSNERASKGFASTLELEGKIDIKLKLDWFFVKPAKLTDPDDESQSYILAPGFGRTLKALNYSLNDRISDHNPMIVDLFLTEPSPVKR